MNKIYIYNGAEYTEDQVIKAAENLGLNFADYIKKYGLKIKGEDLGKPMTTALGAPVEGNQAPESLGLELTPTISPSPKLEIPDTVKTGTTADTIAITEEEQERSKNIVSTLAGRTLRGITTTAANWQSIPENIIYAGIAAANPDMTSEEKIAMKDAIANSVSIATPLSSKRLKDAATALDPMIKKYEDQDIYTAIENGNYTDALEMTVGSALESAPSIAAAMLGPGAIAAFGASIMSGKFDEELRANPNESLGNIALNSLLTGANEAAGELLTRKLLFATKILKQTGAASAAKEYLESGLKQVFKKYGIKPVGEGFSESITEAVNMLIDKQTLDKDITWPQMRNILVEAFTVGTFTGGGINVMQDAYTRPIDQNLAENILMPSQTQFELRDRTDRMSRAAFELQNTNDPNEKKIYLDVMAEEENNIIDIKNRNKYEINSLEGSDLNEYVKNRDQIYKYDDIAKDKSKKEIVRENAKKKITELNKINSNIIDRAVEFKYENTLSTVQREAKDLDLVVKEFRTQQEFDNYMNQKQGVERVRTGIEGTFFRGDGEIVINRQAAIESRNVNVASHELLHGILTNTMKKGGDTAQNLAEDIWNQLDRLTTDESFQDSELYQRILSYRSRPGYSKAMLNEEVLTLFSDALANGDITPSNSILTDLGNQMRRIFYNFGFNRNFNKPNDVFNFLVDYNNSIRKGYVDKSVKRIAREGAQGRMIVKDDTTNTQVGELASQTREQIVEANKKILKDAGGAQNLTAEQRQQIQDNVIKIQNLEQGIEVKPVEGVSRKSVELSERTQKAFVDKGRGFEAIQEIADINAPFINQVVNKLFKEYPGFKESGFTKDDFKFQLTYGLGSRKSNSLFGLVQSYKPETGKALSQYIMQNLENRGKGILQQRIAEQATVGALDITEQIDIATEEALPDIPVRAQRRIISLGISGDVIKDVMSKVKNRLLKDLPVYYKADFKSRLQKDFRQDFANRIKKSWPKKEKWVDYVNKNIRGIYETFTVEKVKASTTGNLRDILYDKGVLKPFNEVREQLIEYYAFPKSTTSTDVRKRTEVSPQLRTQHRTQLAEQISDALGFEAAADILETDPEVSQVFEFKQKMAIMQTGMLKSGFNAKDITDNAVNFIMDKVRNLDITALDSKQKQRLRMFSRAAAKLELMKGKKSIIDINNFIIQELGLDYIYAFNLVNTQYELFKYVNDTDNIDKAKLRELYDKAQEAAKLGIQGEDNIKHDNDFDEFYSEQIGMQEPNELYSVNKKHIIKTLRDGGLLPPNYSKMTKGELLDYMQHLDFKTMADVVSIQEEQRTDTDMEFNKILEQTKGVDMNKVYSDNAAYNANRSKKRFKFFIPSNAEDFEGLIYSFLGKGKLGEQQRKFFEEKLFKPFAKGNYDFNKYKNGLLRDHKNLMKALKIKNKYLEKEMPGTNVTRNTAVRLFLWHANGEEIIGDGTDITAKELDDIVTEVMKDKKLHNYAVQVSKLTNRPEGFVPFNPQWIGGTLGTDLLDYANGTKRKEYLQLWKDNADQIFNKKNLNKIEAIYGLGFKKAIENSLTRMWSGRNRTAYNDSATNRTLDFINGSVGTIMFLNTRSAILQLVSTANFVNWSDNNLFKASTAFANQPQYWKDFMFLMNGEYLVGRRGGLKFDIAADEIAREASGKNAMTKMIKTALRKGFVLTQFADSFAIASGGATFYRNRLKKYLKEGMIESDAKEQALLDFQEISETSQQSSRPDKISQIQAGLLGRIVFAFANTPMQYARLMKKATLDLKNRRGNDVENISKLAYYGFVQAIFFNALQQALDIFELGDDDMDEQEEKKVTRAVNSALDSWLRGIGLPGAVLATLKNMGLEVYEMEKTGKYDEYKVAEKALQISPPLSAKFSKLVSAGRTYAYKQEREKVRTKGLSIENPAFMATGRVASALANIPMDRVVQKAENISIAMNEETETWNSIALLAGWNKWNLGLVEKTKKKKTGQRRKSSRTQKR